MTDQPAPGEPDPDAALAIPDPVLPPVEASDVSYEIALDGEPGPAAAVYVDATPAGQRLPVLPDFLRGAEGMRRGARRAGPVARPRGGTGPGTRRPRRPQPPLCLPAAARAPCG